MPITVFWPRQHGILPIWLPSTRWYVQADSATLLGVPQPKVSALENYRLDQFSIERLMEFLTALNQDVEIIIRPRANSSETGHGTRVFDRIDRLLDDEKAESGFGLAAEVSVQFSGRGEGRAQYLRDHRWYDLAFRERPLVKEYNLP